MRGARALFLIPVVVATASMAVPACGDDETAEVRAALGGGCLINTDCQDPYVCVFRRCHQQCASDKDCTPPLLCKRGEHPYFVCDLEDEMKCAYNSDCPPGQVCGIDLRCRDQCATSRDCIEGQVCAAGTCAKPDELVDGVLLSKKTGDGDGWPCTHNSDCEDDAGTKKLVCRSGLCAVECKGNADCVTPPFECNLETGGCLGTDGFYCFPGALFACTCEDGGTGTQECLENQIEVGPCTCP